MTTTDPQHARSEWDLYRRGLPARQRGEEAAFDAMWDGIAESLHVLPRRAPMIDVLLLIGIQQEATLQELRAEVDRVKAEVRARVGAPAGGEKAATPTPPAGHGARAHGQQRLGE